MKRLTFLRIFILAILAGSSLVFAAAPETFPVSSLKFTRPAKWEWVEVTSSMRKAQLKVPGAEGKDGAEVVFFHFGAGNGGGTQANVERWFGQFKEPREQIKAKSEDTTVSGSKVTFVSAQGTYQSGMPGGPRTAMTDYALYGAIIESPDGSVFVKMTGPQKLVTEATADFKKMIESGLKK